MKKQKEYRKHRLPQTKLRALAKVALLNMNRDIAALGARGITANDATVLQQKIEAWDNFPTDDELKGMCMDAVLQKTKANEALMHDLKMIKNMAWVHFKGKGYFHCFHFERLHNRSQEDFWRYAKSVRRVAINFQSQLADEGLTPAKLNDLQAKITDVEAKIEEVDAADTNRIIASVERTDLANDLWATVDRINKIGRSVFGDADEARANDYLS